MSGSVDSGIICEINPNGTKTACIYSIEKEDLVEFLITEMIPLIVMWAKYVFGVVKEMQKRGVNVEGFNTCFTGNVPLGAGMSSSAALESCYAFVLNELFTDKKLEKMGISHSRSSYRA